MESNNENKSTFGLNQNLASALCYLTWVAGIVFFLSEKNDKRVRFHALQSLIFGISMSLLRLLINTISFWLLFALLPLTPGIIANMISFAYLVITIFLAVSTYQGKNIELPVVGAIARKKA